MVRFSLGCVVLVVGLWTTAAHATFWYVDNTANGSNNGTSWANAWTSLATISWASVSAGDTVYISGGAVSKTYNEYFSTLKSGTAGQVITVSTGQDASHNGTVIINPGAKTLLPGATLEYFHLTGNVGGAQKMQVTGTSYVFYYTPGKAIHLTGVHLSYIDFGARDYMWYMYPSMETTGFEMDHCNVEKLSTGTGGNGKDSTLENIGSNAELALGAAPYAYDTNLIHHNTFKIHNGDASANQSAGPDLVRWGSGISFYNNTVTMITEVNGCGNNCGQHQDLFQLQMSHYKIYNNIFIGGTGQGFFFSGFGAPKTVVTGMLIYNNLWLNTSASNSYMHILSIAIQVAQQPKDLQDVIFVNNTIVDFKNPGKAAPYGAIHIKATRTCTNCRIQNNLFVNSSNLRYDDSDVAVTVSNNTPAASASPFVNYIQHDTRSNNHHLAAGDGLATGQGINLSSLGIATLNLDFDGNTRGTTWDIGAYSHRVVGQVR